MIKVNAAVGIDASKNPPIQNEGNAIKSNFPFNFVSGSSILIVSKANLIPVIKKIAIKIIKNTAKPRLLAAVSTADIFSAIRSGSVIT
jgi:hypothetical protein